MLRWWRTIIKQKAVTVTVLIILFAFILPMTWFPEGHIIFRGDPFFPLDPVQYFKDSWSIWQGKVNLGAEKGLPIAFLPYQLIQAIPVWLGASDRVAEIIHFMIWFALPGLTMALFIHALCKRLAVTNWSIPIATSFYLFNLYRLAQFGDNNHLLVYTAIPLALYCITRYFDNPGNWVRYASGIALTTLLLSRSGTNPPMYLMFYFAVGIYGLILSIVHWKIWKQTLRFWLLTSIGSLLVNVFWIVPFTQTLLRQTSLSGAGNLDWLAELSNHTTLARVLRLMGAWDWSSKWEGELYLPFAAMYEQPLWWNLALVPILLVPICFLFKRGRNFYTLSILLIGAIGLIFSQGSKEPFGPLFELAVQHVPFFWIFRSPWYKFTNLTVFSTSVLMGLGIGLLYDWLQKTRISPARYGLVFLLILFPMILAHPFVTGERWTAAKDVTFVPAEVIPFPNHIRQAADWLNQEPGETAVGLLPYMGSEIYRWGYGSIVDPFFFMSRRPVFVKGDRIGYQPNQTPGASVAFRVFKEMLYAENPDAIHVARLLGLEYVMVRYDFRHDFYPGSTDDPALAEERIKKVFPEASLVATFGPPPANIGFPDAPTGDWKLYRLPDVKENPIFTTNWVASFVGHPIDALGILTAEAAKDRVFPGIFFTTPIAQADQAEVERIASIVKRDAKQPNLSIEKVGYNRFHVTGQATAPFLLVLNQSFDSNWIVRSANGSQATVGKQVVVNGYSPGWLVEPYQAGRFSLLVEFAPQRFVYPLLALSGAVIIGLIWASIYFGRRSS